MTANQHLAASCPTLDEQTRQRLFDTGYPDRGACTGNDLLCTCSFHVRHRARQNPDPFLPDHGVASVQQELAFSREYLRTKCHEANRDTWKATIAELEQWLEENTYAAE